ncbi:MAG: hypothetical protein P1V20_22065 [Verrucomicrobiales bacterium]|nr:hypothetical protein [Verrucomicrobiales bacterium]
MQSGLFTPAAFGENGVAVADDGPQAIPRFVGLGVKTGPLIGFGAKHRNHPGNVFGERQVYFALRFEEMGNARLLSAFSRGVPIALLCVTGFG